MKKMMKNQQKLFHILQTSESFRLLKFSEVWEKFSNLKHVFRCFTTSHNENSMSKINERSLTQQKSHESLLKLLRLFKVLKKTKSTFKDSKTLTVSKIQLKVTQ